MSEAIVFRVRRRAREMRMRRRQGPFEDVVGRPRITRRKRGRRRLRFFECVIKRARSGRSPQARSSPKSSQEGRRSVYGTRNTGSARRTLWSTERIGAAMVSLSTEREFRRSRHQLSRLVQREEHYASLENFSADERDPAAQEASNAARL
jgi:hypothetical protein